AVTVLWKSTFRLFSAIAVAILLAAPWSIMNQGLYCDPLAQRAMLSAVEFLLRRKSIFSPYFRHVFPQNLSASFVGVFGWYSLWSPKWVYHFFWLIGAVGLAGDGIRLARLIIKRVKSSRPGMLPSKARPEAQDSNPRVTRTEAEPGALGSSVGSSSTEARPGAQDSTSGSLRFEARLASLLLLIPLLNLIVVIYINLLFDQPQGRYMFPSLPALAVLVAIGLSSLPYWRPVISRILVAGLALVNLYVLIAVVLPGYWPPPHMALSDAAKLLEPETADASRARDLRLAPFAARA